MGCTGDGWHKVGDARVLVRNRVIVEILMQDSDGNWTPRRILRFNRQLRKWTLTGRITVDALRSGARRGTICIG